MNSTAEIPQDSVLRRHWQASRELEMSTSRSSARSSTAPSSGFFSWLKSLFG